MSQQDRQFAHHNDHPDCNTSSSSPKGLWPPTSPTTPTDPYSLSHPICRALCFVVFVAFGAPSTLLFHDTLCFSFPALICFLYLVQCCSIFSLILVCPVFFGGACFAFWVRPSVFLRSQRGNHRRPSEHQTVLRPTNPAGSKRGRQRDKQIWSRKSGVIYAA